jgi:hypothetical protein
MTPIWDWQILVIAIIAMIVLAAIFGKERKEK